MEQLTSIDTEVERLMEQLAATQRELDECRAGIRRQLELAAGVHNSLLPKPIRDERIDLDVRYIPIEEVGGDYCHVRFPEPDTLFIAVSDSTGHGIGPALLATRASSEVRYGILYGRMPRDIVRALNTFICDHFGETGLYLSFIVARIDLYRRQLTWCGAGHPSPLLLRRDGTTVEQLHSQNPLIGVTKDFLADEPEHTVAVEPGDRLLFYTDGLTDAVDEAGRQLGTAGLAQMARESMSVGLFDLADHILDRVTRHNHGPPLDDKTLIVAQLK